MTAEFTNDQKQLLWEACLDWIEVWEATPRKKAGLEKQLSFRVEQLKKGIPNSNLDKLVEDLAQEMHALQQNIRDNVRQSSLAAAQARYVRFVTDNFTQTRQEAELEARRIEFEALNEI